MFLCYSINCSNINLPQNTPAFDWHSEESNPCNIHDDSSEELELQFICSAKEEKFALPKQLYPQAIWSKLDIIISYWQ